MTSSNTGATASVMCAMRVPALASRKVNDSGWQIDVAATQGQNFPVRMPVCKLIMAMRHRTGFWFSGRRAVVPARPESGIGCGAVSARAS